MAKMDGAKQLLAKGFEKSLSIQQPVAKANVERLRRVHPDKTPKELIKYLSRTYLAAVTATGAGAGAAAAVPGAGLAVGIPAALADVMAFTEASVLYVLSVAEVHNLHPEDIERRRLLVMTVMLGDSAAGAVKAGVGRIGPHWAKQIINAIPMRAIDSMNKVLGPRFITKYGTKQGVLVLGKQLPAGIGIVLGGGGNVLVGRGVIASSRRIFGEPPTTWPGGPEEAIDADDVLEDAEAVPADYADVVLDDEGLSDLEVPSAGNEDPSER
jgi:hypothetical protein